MNFSFKVLDLKCNSVLSSDDSPWGAEDGIRLMLFVWTGTQHNESIISGREFPEPDLVDNYKFTPGTQLDLWKYPPQNKSTWETDPIDVGDGENVWLAVIGVNEGLPSVEGGGGGVVGGIFLFAVEEFVKALVGGACKDPHTEVAQAPTAAAVGTGFELLNKELAAVNAPDDCRGVAFAYETVFSARYLFSEHITR